MKLSSSDSASSTDDSAAQRFRFDIESVSGADRGNQSQSLIRVWKIPIPLRKASIVPDLIRNLACISTLLCIAQQLYIVRLKQGLVRVANDPYDIRFGQDIDRNSKSIWDDERQPFLHDAFPVPVHSHNDYWRRIPLFEAIGSGCISVEADVHLRDNNLVVGHTARSLNKNSTLRSMYLEPLQRMIEEQNANVTEDTWRGLFNRAPQQTFVLLVDHKTAGVETLAELHAQLQSLRDLDYLTYWNGSDRIMRPLTVVATGNAPFEAVIALEPQHRDIFWDAPLERLSSIDDDFSSDPIRYAYNRSNSYLASTPFSNARLWSSHWDHAPSLSSPRLADMGASQIEQAKARGLLSRYWDTPEQPPNLREIVWRVLVDAEVDLLNMDDLGTVRARAKGWGAIAST